MESRRRGYRTEEGSLKGITDGLLSRRPTSRPITESDPPGTHLIMTERGCARSVSRGVWHLD